MSVHSISQVLNSISQLRQQAAISGQRRMLVCAGDVSWCQQIVEHSLGIISDSGCSLYVGETDMAGISTVSAKQSRQWLGRELDFLIFDAWSGFDVDAFGALSGTVRAGGILLLLLPDLNDLQAWVDPEHRRIQVYPQQLKEVSGYYLQRLASLIKDSGLVTTFSQSDGLLLGQSIISNHIESGTNPLKPEFPCKTSDQHTAVAAIHKVVKGHRRRPLVLTADRGRGKSAALGIAAGQLINNGLEKILVTAPAKKTIEVLYRHAAEVTSNPETLESKLCFIAPDELVHELPGADLLLVDEAAAIPAPLLEKMLNHYSRVAFASTIHGYEGTGRGFAIRFRKTLDKKTPQWRALHITQPIRWADNDPLEAFVFKALLLNAEAAKVESMPEIPADQYEFRRISAADLVANESLLQELFGLLVLAHYQTRPFDLRHMLDGGNIEIYGLFSRGHLVATVLAAREGEIESELEDPVWLGQRRVRGHLLPQSLSHHLGIKQAVLLKGMRVIRIAVHPERQHQGLGLYLLDNIKKELRQQQYDYLGTAFGASDELLDFWHKAGLKTVRMGVTRDAASGTHSALMIKPLSDDGEQLLQEGMSRFRQQFHWLLLEELQSLEAGIVVRLLKQTSPEEDESLDGLLERDLYSYCHGQRQYDSCIAALKIRAHQLLAKRSLTEQETQLLVGKVLQNRSWVLMGKQLALPGKKQVQALLRDAFSKFD